MSDKSASQQIDDIIKTYGGWKGETLSVVREVVHAADPEIEEEIKWKMKNRPEGLPVWSHDGIVCFAETWKDNIKLIFHKGASLKDEGKLFNARLESKDLRALEIREGDTINKAALKKLVLEAVAFNASKAG